MNYGKYLKLDGDPNMNFKYIPLLRRMGPLGSAVLDLKCQVETKTLGLPQDAATTASAGNCGFLDPRLPRPCSFSLNPKLTRLRI